MEKNVFWHSISTHKSEYPPLDNDLEVDVLIIGAGITGATAAQALLQTGKTVAIVEAHRVGEGTTGSSTGNLYIPVQPYFQNIVAKFDLNTAKQIAQSRLMAIDYIEKNVNTHEIDCHFARRPWYAYTQEATDFFEKEFETFQKMELNAAYCDDLPFDLRGKKAIVLHNQGRFNPLQYVISLIAALEKKGCKIYENTAVISMEEQPKYCQVQTQQGKRIQAKKVFLATHTPIGVNITQMFTAPYRSYVLGVHLKDDIYPDAHLWKMGKSKYSISTHAQDAEKPQILLVAGSSHKTGQDKNMLSHFSDLESFTKKHFQVRDVIYKWSAQHYHAADDIPYIGLAHRQSKHIYMATGYFADGLVYGTLGGLMVADLIEKNQSDWSEVYKANRLTPFASLTSLVKENMNVMGEYAQDLPMVEFDKFNHIKKGEGKIVQIKQEKFGITRDDNNKLHMVSAVCTHMKCIVNWNNAEKTWDCPCHGSRFKPTGDVIEGPATQNLKTFDCGDKS